MRRLLLANAALLVLLLGHVADHVLRQPDAAQLPFPENSPGILGVAIVVASLVLVAVRHRLAVPVAIAVGTVTALGFVAIHLLPAWGPFSDPYPSRDLDAGSWLQMLTTLTGGLLLAGVAVSEARRSRPVRPPERVRSAAA
jgi:mannose/fructose/N-acetylgalactosamine-specific phosphotransferase system component IIC